MGRFGFYRRNSLRDLEGQRRNPIQPQINHLAQYALMNLSPKIEDEFFRLMGLRGQSYALSIMAEKLLKIINKPIFPAILYAVANDILVEDFYRALIDVDEDKLLYYISKLVNNKSRTLQVMDQMEHLIKVENAWGMLPVFDRSALPSIDYYYYGDGLNPADYAAILADFINRTEEEDITISQNPDLTSILFKEVAAEYGVNPTVLAVKTENLQVQSEALKIQGQIRQQKLEEAIRFKQEEALLRELEQQEQVALRIAEQRAEKERQIIRSESERLQKIRKAESEESESERLRRVQKPRIEPLKKKYLFIVGGLESDIPAWIRNTFEIKHASGHGISSERVVRMLGERIPDAVLVMKYASHTITTPATDLARLHRIPILIARPSISTAVKKAAEYGPAWFAAAYPKSLRKNPEGFSGRIV